MPFAAATATTQMVAKASSLNITGKDFYNVASAVAATCESQFVMPNTVTVTASGTAGAGMIVGSAPIVGPVPEDMALFINSNMPANAYTGASSYNLCLAISTGIVAALPGLVLSGPVPVVGIGACTAKITGLNPSTFAAVLTGEMSKRLIVGVQVSGFIKALSDGICLYLNTKGTVTIGTLAGSPSNVAAAIVCPGMFA